MAATPPAFLNRQPLALYEAPRRLPLALDTRKGRIAMGSVRSRLGTAPWARDVWPGGGEGRPGRVPCPAGAWATRARDRDVDRLAPPHGTVQGGLTWVDRGLSRPVRARGRKGRIGTRKRAFRGETLPTAPPTASCVSRKRRNPAIVALWTPDLFSVFVGNTAGESGHRTRPTKADRR